MLLDTPREDRRTRQVVEVGQSTGVLRDRFGYGPKSLPVALWCIWKSREETMTTMEISIGLVLVLLLLIVLVRRWYK